MFRQLKYCFRDIAYVCTAVVVAYHESCFLQMRRAW